MWNGDMRLWEVQDNTSIGSSTFLVLASSLKELKYLCKADERVPTLKALSIKGLLITPTIIYPCHRDCDEPALEHDLAYEPDETKEATG